MKVISVSTIGNLISAHMEGDNEKFLIFANFIADAYEEAGEVRCARIIRKRIDGTYKNDSTVTIDDCFEVLIREKKKGTKNIKATREQAERVAWRILKDWVATQMALLDMQMVRFEEIFLPYIETDNGQTVFERLKEKQFLIEINDESKL